MTLSFPSLSQADDVAILIDGYCMLVNRSSNSLWRSMTHDEIPSLTTSPPAFLAPHPSDLAYSHVRDGNDEEGDDDDDDSNGDYAEVLAPEYEIDRKQIQMIELLGNGQFGEVYRGILKVSFSKIQFSLYLSLRLDESTIRNQYRDQNL